jgi:hypothetical protein
MWALLGKLVSSFLLVRDFFGYMIPGAVFVGIVLYSGKASFVQPAWASGSLWIALAILVGISYVAGHILAAAGYVLHDILGPILRRLNRMPAANKPAPEERRQAGIEAQYYRYLYPALFYDVDRRATISILRVGLAAALLAGSWLLGSWPLAAAGVAAGLFMLNNAYTARAHVDDLAALTLQAARKAEAKRVPYFKWSEGGKDKPDGDKKEKE